MQLLLVTNVYPTPVEPGKGLFNHYLARALAAKHRVNVIAPVPWADELLAKNRRSQLFPPNRAEDKDGVSVYYPRYYYPPRVLRSWYGWFYWRSICRVVQQVTDLASPDAIVSYWVHPDGEAALRASRKCGVPSAVVVGGSDVLVLTRQPRRRRCVSKVLRSSDAVIAVSADLGNEIRALGVPPENVYVWDQGIDSDIFFPGDRAGARGRLGIAASAPALLWVGRMVPVKGLEVLLDACAILSTRAVDYRLYLVGDGPLRRSLEEKARCLGLGSRVEFVGARLHDELPDWYRAADLLVLPSYSEGVPNVLRESVACGTPFVASRVGGIPEIAAEGCSRLVRPGDAVALADAVGASLASRGGRVQPAPCSPSWSESADAFVRILEPLVSRRQPRASAPREAYAPLR